MRSLSHVTIALIIASLPVAPAQESVGSGSSWLDRAVALHPPMPVTDPPVRKTGLPGFRDVARILSPSVVNIQTRTVLHRRMHPRGSDAFGPSEPLGDQFHWFFSPAPTPRIQPRERPALGSGVIVSEDGYILTNNHVVKDAAEIRVTLHDGKTHAARLVGQDPPTDLAVLKIDAKGLTAASFADSDSIQVGDWVVAMGNPFGLANTMTTGIVSAKGRTRVGLLPFEDFIQTDAAINPGNSGGPLADLNGRVVGINTAIASRSGGYMGIGFAIPSTLARQVMEKLIAEGKVERGWLGVSIQDLDEPLARTFGRDDTRGVLIARVLEDQPADQAGLRSGDIILSIDGKATPDSKSLRSLVAELAPGRSVPCSVYRDGKTTDLEVKIGRYRVADTEAPLAPADGHLGLRLDQLPESTARRHYDLERSAPVVTRVEPGSRSAMAGLRRGDVILSINGREVETVADVRTTLREASGPVRLLVRSTEGQRWVVLSTKG